MTGLIYALRLAAEIWLVALHGFSWQEGKQISSMARIAKLVYFSWLIAAAVMPMELSVYHPSRCLCGASNYSLDMPGSQIFAARPEASIYAVTNSKMLSLMALAHGRGTGMTA